MTDPVQLGSSTPLPQKREANLSISMQTVYGVDSFYFMEQFQNQIDKYNKTHGSNISLDGRIEKNVKQESNFILLKNTPLNMSIDDVKNIISDSELKIAPKKINLTFNYSRVGNKDIKISINADKSVNDRPEWHGWDDPFQKNKKGSHF